jgi:hypothetical protein
MTLKSVRFWSLAMVFFFAKEATMLDGFAVTPRYVLRDGSHPSGPSVMQTEGQAEANVIFGFSDKPQYDAFLQQSLIALTPYPLVKGFLQNQVDLAAAALGLMAFQLVVLDAGGPQQSILRAATMKAIREAFDHKQDSVEVTHELTFDAKTGLYRIEMLAALSNHDVTDFAAKEPQ